MSEGYSPAFSRNDQSPIAKWFWTVDRGLLAAALTLMSLGVALSFASSPAAIHADQSIADPFHYSWRMLVWASMGLVIMLTTSLLSPRDAPHAGSTWGPSACSRPSSPSPA